MGIRSLGESIRRYFFGCGHKWTEWVVFWHRYRTCEHCREVQSYDPLTREWWKEWSKSS